MVTPHRSLLPESVRTRVVASNQTAETVPVELMSSIFLLTLDNATLVTSDVRSTPLNISQVCQYWRGIALAVPQLWSSLSMDLGSGCPDIPQLTSTWLFRAEKCDLSVAMFFPADSGTEACLASLHTHSANLNHLRVDASDVHIRLPALERLSALQMLDLSLRYSASRPRVFSHNPCPPCVFFSSLGGPQDPA
ncbi:hypothetical protein NEOLEDRAFT_761402 [Neolentinus lepideus HHB14362 ss-1]|uniref:Uncharacterized protein n=1 Tax=Neolentinus lepideus HHB14362 ss-1 TaxID=1314782 RepID=A0A165PNQ0_9AGAM|nr:hypothetical protein NEOLEDRAFT_761402 [Neolentinus lepideus HHB14362 ss-1]